MLCTIKMSHFAYPFSLVPNTSLLAPVSLCILLFKMLSINSCKFYPHSYLSPRSPQCKKEIIRSDLQVLQLNLIMNLEELGLKIRYFHGMPDGT